ncbi:hypothetical protein ANME2D_00534 [Candidatus Methanoperedens nitroreducens]|uniref:Uncharacterized protein n=1 Tax=Candidatus Methanoperedens nitratireducens TaxID=1392998 RepID=A0A062V334_9EURY|nr:hypothetical protein [Candidatus Methanoperedens nitroreducens]KCZ73466.1 hypothetical protein ANME2D_00534 [Candidatus Methanoperedens nitroreducens]MDJ1422578.1 hypothetical protein [Candidatus Methanoperedens sp.]
MNTLTAQEATILLKNLAKYDLTDLEREAISMAVTAITTIEKLASEEVT